VGIHPGWWPCSFNAGALQPTLPHQIALDRHGSGMPWVGAMALETLQWGILLWEAYLDDAFPPPAASWLSQTRTLFVAQYFLFWAPRTIGDVAGPRRGGGGRGAELVFCR